MEESKESLIRTPELLPVLKEVGVVDSGGAGLVTIFEGFLSAMKGTVIQKEEAGEAIEGVQASMESEEFGYCTEFIIRLSERGMKNFREDSLRDSLASIGNSIVCVQDDDIVKVHVHTLTPGDALNMGQRYGEFVKLKVENMQEQHENIMMNAAVEKEEAPQQPKSKYAVSYTHLDVYKRQVQDAHRTDSAAGGHRRDHGGQLFPCMGIREIQ